MESCLSDLLDSSHQEVEQAQVINMNNAPADLLEVTNPRADSPPKEDVPTNAAAPTALPSAAATTKKISRRKLFRRLITAATLPLASGAYGTEVEPFWIDWHDVPMPIRDLPKSFDGFRITQLTDLHAGPYVPMSYLSGVVDRVIKSKPDLVIVTGDLVNHTLVWVVPVRDLLARIPAEAGIPVIATLGNHDYDVSSAYAGVPTRIADALQAALAARQITLLRNRATPIAHPDGRLWFVGLEDLWSGRFSPQVAFAGLNAKEPIIALSHNPDTAS